MIMEVNDLNPTRPDPTHGGEIALDIENDSFPTEDITEVVGGRENELKPSRRKLTSQVSKQVMQASRKLWRVTTTAALPAQGVQELDKSKHAVARALNGLHFVDQKVLDGGWVDVEKRFEELSKGEPLLKKTQFSNCIGWTKDEDKEFGEELFDALARKREIETGAITKDQLHDFWNQLSNPSFNVRAQTFFDLVDKNADGKITEEEVEQILKVSASANKLSIENRAAEYAAFIVEALNPDGGGYIKLDNLKALLEQSAANPSDDGVTKSQPPSIFPSRLGEDKELNPIERLTKSTYYFVVEHWDRIWFILLWLGICAGLFSWKFIQYKNRYVFHVMGYCVSTAKGAAETLKFNMALILFPVCRNTITWLRSRTMLGMVLPFDYSIDFHKIVAYGIAIGVAIHAICHLTCDFPRLLHASDEDYAPLAKYFHSTKPPNYGWFLKGTEGWTGLVMVVLMTIAFVLAQPWFRTSRVKLPNTLKKLTGFNAFWYSHHLFVVVYVLLIVHGWFLFLSKEWYKKTTWMYIAIPVILYAYERGIRALRSNYKTVENIEPTLYKLQPNSKKKNALALKMSKPNGFRYTSGQYIFVNCSDVSPFEWHPFSLTSAPGDDYIRVHIKSAGDWTSQLISLFDKNSEQPTDQNRNWVVRSHVDEGASIPREPKIKIDGPYGAPSQDYKKYEVLLLVSLGIGATPMISIIKDVMYHIKQRKNLDSNIVTEEENNRHNMQDSHFAVKRVYFYWVTPDQGSYEWFRSVMNEVVECDHDKVIEIHNYCTSVHEVGDARSALITMLQSLQHATNGMDIVSQTHIHTHFARPKWNAAFKSVALRHPDQTVGVFFCGQQGPVKELKRNSKHFTRTTSTKFDFHKENF